MSNHETKRSVLNALRDTASTQLSERLLLTFLILRADPNKDFTCWPSYDRIMKDTRLGVTTLKRALSGLEKKGLIYRESRHNRSSMFKINVRQIMKEAAELQAAEVRQLPSERQAPTELLHIDHDLLVELKETGKLNLSDDDLDFIGLFELCEEPGSFCGHKIDVDGRWSKVPNNFEGKDCLTCGGHKRECVTLMDAIGNTLTIEKDEPCEEC